MNNKNCHLFQLVTGATIDAPKNELMSHLTDLSAT